MGGKGIRYSSAKPKEKCRAFGRVTWDLRNKKKRILMFMGI